jgi:hypothetical protein
MIDPAGSPYMRNNSLGFHPSWWQSAKTWYSSVPKLLFPTPLQGEHEEEFSNPQKLLKSQALIMY